MRQFLQSAYNAHYLATSRESRRYVVAYSRFAGAIWLRQESLRHMLASPGCAPGTIAVNVTWIERELFNACQKHRSMYPSIFNRFPLCLTSQLILITTTRQSS